MSARAGFPILLTATLVICLGGAAALHAQSPAEDQSSRLQKIQVDEQCQVLTPDSGEMKSDLDICHLDGRGVIRSSHVAAKEVDGARQHSRVDVVEQTYMLQDIYAEPVSFVVSQKVPEGWHIDSDPQPKSMEGDTAIFRVIAMPGQIVRLHVGMSHETPLEDGQ